MSRKAFHILLKRYLEGKSNEAERKIVEQWYSILDDDELREIEHAELSEINEKLWNRINTRVTPGGALRSAESGSRMLGGWTKLAVAASLTGLLAIAAYFVVSKQQVERFPGMALNAELITSENTTASPLDIVLEDGSHVVLQPSARLKYPAHFPATERQVFIEGEAFFEVSKDPARPFFVYSANLVTRVVGTSFIVKTGTSLKESEVSVLTGKVVVFKNGERTFYQKLIPSKRDEVLLTRNQKVIYNTRDEKLIVTLIEKPLPANPDEKKEEGKPYFTFNDTRLADVFAEIEKAYGVQIILQNPNDVRSCTFTGDIHDQGMYGKLELICQSVGATYGIEDGKIVVSGGRCD